MHDNRCCLLIKFSMAVDWIGNNSMLGWQFLCLLLSGFGWRLITLVSCFRNMHVYVYLVTIGIFLCILGLATAYSTPKVLTVCGYNMGTVHIEKTQHLARWRPWILPSPFTDHSIVLILDLAIVRCYNPRPLMAA